MDSDLAATAIAAAVLGQAAETGHILGDYVAQTDRQATRKGAPGYNPGDGATGTRTGLAASWRADLGHVATYHLTLAATTGIALAATGVRLDPRRAAAALAWSAATHTLIDRRWPVEKVMRWTGSSGWWPHGRERVDQALHRGCLWAGVLYAAQGARVAR